MVESSSSEIKEVRRACLTRPSKSVRAGSRAVRTGLCSCAMDDRSGGGGGERGLAGGGAPLGGVVGAMLEHVESKERNIGRQAGRRGV